MKWYLDLCVLVYCQLESILVEHFLRRGQDTISYGPYVPSSYTVNVLKNHQHNAPAHDTLSNEQRPYYSASLGKGQVFSRRNSAGRSFERDALCVLVHSIVLVVFHCVRSPCSEKWLRQHLIDAVPRL